ncbi:MAG: GNAT family N-acetyltransferase [Alphaproteobacteria bacterium]|nr:GNAT family N-acetyltransferase [Rhizobiaceae bacterium]MBU3963219.1 GNAT family N-acetyltransferase [Alphaproteobacteria bacterium]MBU4048821.1 GNAT family N-acetyltransferase [Alphaproteobacteria bacterium]MBU4088233.1 GNAT family N-acetyltransferase [Alphaproteobacteria bacterium]MBU4158826.1 GNAT family N-acetyltransferase [Alphaproteobacteria bacterium]
MRSTAKGNSETLSVVPPLDGSLVLRRPQPEDLAKMQENTPSAEIARMSGSDANESWDANAEGERLYHRVMATPFGWLIEVEGRTIGQIRLTETDLRHKRGRLAMGLFSDAWLGRGYGRRAIALMLHHLFENEGFHRVDLRVLSFNRRAIRCYLSCGFQIEGYERDVFNLKGVWYGDWMMAVLAHETRILPLPGDQIIN